jgi:hypothetical protein
MAASRRTFIAGLGAAGARLRGPGGGPAASGGRIGARPCLRFSAHVFNTQVEIEAAAATLRAELG